MERADMTLTHTPPPTSPKLTLLMLSGHVFISIFISISILRALMQSSEQG